MLSMASESIYEYKKLFAKPNQTEQQLEKAKEEINH